MMQRRDMALPTPGGKRSTDLVRNGGGRLVEDRGRCTRFHVLAELVQQDGPVRVAFAEIAACVRPPAVPELDQRATIGLGYEGELGLGPDGISRPVDTAPRHVVLAGVGNDPPVECRPVHEIKAPATAPRIAHRSTVPSLKSLAAPQCRSDPLGIGFYLDLVMDIGHRAALCILIHSFATRLSNKYSLVNWLTLVEHFAALA